MIHPQLSPLLQFYLMRSQTPFCYGSLLDHLLLISASLCTLKPQFYLLSVTPGWKVVRSLLHNIWFSLFGSITWSLMSHASISDKYIGAQATSTSPWTVSLPTSRFFCCVYFVFLLSFLKDFLCHTITESAFSLSGQKDCVTLKNYLALKSCFAFILFSVYHFAL